MDDSDTEERIRLRAYELWERQGRPEGRTVEHWDQARHEIEQEDAGALASVVTESVGLAVGQEPEKPKGRRRPAQDNAAEGDRGTVERELARQDGNVAGSSQRKRRTPD